jgi:putative transposase
LSHQFAETQPKSAKEPSMDEKKREEIALFRYSLIVPFLTEEELEWGVKGELVKRMARQIHHIPFSKKASLHESTIRRFLTSYRNHGFDGLKPKTRSDIGTSLKIPTDILEQAFILKKEEPRRSAGKIIRIMESTNMAAPGLIKPSTLYRIFEQNSLVYKKLKRQSKEFKPFQAEHPNQIWQSDVMYGPYLPDPDRPEAKKRTFLVAILDDFSRLIVHAEFYWHERLPHLENTLQKAILKRGIPEVLYVDNGQIFSAHQINIICAELGIRKISCQPYRPQGKGKIERYFRSVREQFLVELEHDPVEHLHQLNSKYWAWLEQAYHLQTHSATNEQPLVRWRQNVAGFLKNIDEKQLQDIFLWREIRKVDKLAQVSLQGFKYELSSFMAGKKVEIRFNHFDLSEVLIYCDGRFMQKAKQAGLPRWNKANKQLLPPSPEPILPSGVKPLQRLEEKNHLEKIKQAKTILGKENPPPADEATFTKAHFIKHLANGLRRNLESFHPLELQEIDQAWQQHGPFIPASMNIALAKTIIEKGVEQHISFYLDAVIQAHLKSSPKKES